MSESSVSDDQTSCATCKFFVTDDGAFGDCHRYPPLGPIMRPHNDGMEYALRHRPSVDWNEWCGEWQRRLEA